MSDTTANLLSVMLMLATGTLILFTLLTMIVIILTLALRRRFRWVERQFNRVPIYEDFSLVKPRDSLSKEEVKDVKALLRARKEREARDQETLDTASEFNRDI